MIIVIIYILFVDDIVALTRAYKTKGLGTGIGISKVVVLGIFIFEFAIQVFANWREYLKGIFTLLPITLLYNEDITINLCIFGWICLQLDL